MADESQPLHARGRPRREGKRRGYSSESRRSHPGVTIATEKRSGGARLVLRWKDSLTGKWKKTDVVDFLGKPVVSRVNAQNYAIKKSRELQGEHHEMLKGRRPVDTEITWDELKLMHRESLQTRNRAGRTVKDYEQSWKFLARWPQQPCHPHDTKVGDLERFVRFLRAHRSRTGKPLEASTVAGVARHIKAVLNYGRKRLSCVRLDSESIGMGLDVGTLPQKEPIALSTGELKKIIEAAKAHGATHRHTDVLPFLLFLMLTGCRRGEGEAMRFAPSRPGAEESWCDFEADRVMIWDSKRSRHKNVSLTTRPMLKKMLEDMQNSRDVEAEPYIFGGKLPLAIGEKRKNTIEGEVGKSLKSALAKVRYASGVKYALKDLRSTAATYLANSDIGSNLYIIAGELGHDYKVLVKHYAGHRRLPETQRKAITVEGVLGIAGVRID